MTCPCCAARDVEQVMLVQIVPGEAWRTARCFGCGHTVPVPPEPQW